MSRYNVPVDSPKPDIQGFLAAMQGQRIPDKVPLVEYLIDNAVMKPILGKMIGRKWIDTSDKTEFVGGQMNLSREN